MITTSLFYNQNNNHLWSHHNQHDQRDNNEQVLKNRTGSKTQIINSSRQECFGGLIKDLSALNDTHFCYNCCNGINNLPI